MLPYNLLFKIGSKAVGGFMTRRAEKSERKHQIALQEMQTGNERAKRNGSLILDLVLGAFHTSTTWHTSLCYILWRHGYVKKSRVLF